jgi:hypothetical protein
VPAQIKNRAQAHTKKDQRIVVVEMVVVVTTTMMIMITQFSSIQCTRAGSLAQVPITNRAQIHKSETQNNKKQHIMMMMMMVMMMMMTRASRDLLQRKCEWFSWSRHSPVKIHFNLILICTPKGLCPQVTSSHQALPLTCHVHLSFP